MDQLVDLYKDLHENIISNCDTQIFMGSQSIKTCEYISKSLGQKTLVYQSRSKNRDKEDISTQGYSYSEQRQGRELMTIDELKRLPYDEEIILVRGVKPIKAKKAWYYKYHPLKDKLEEYKIHDNSEMPIIDEVPVCTVDVKKHLEERMNRARKATTTNQAATATSSGGNAKTNTNNEDIDIDTNLSTNLDSLNNLDTQVEDIDLEKELERKFDELFGKNSDSED